ncbi:MAG: hypothetical protein ACPH26_10705, partial [Candidatus Puniceispirillaceae bacterium]
NTTVVFEGKPIGTPDAGTFWRVIDEHKVRSFFTAPTAFRAIKRADRMAAWLEATQLAGFSEDEAAKILHRPRATPTTMRLRPVPPDQATEMFLKKFRLLGGDS